jgi:hypothetical protein
VQAHPDANWPRAELPLALAGRRERIPRPRERDEERVALGVDLDPAVPPEGLAERASMLGQRIRVGIAELVQQPRRALDVGKEEGDGAGRELAHQAQ